MFFVRFKSTPLLKILRLKEGELYFQCVCGRPGKVKLKDFKPTSRCIKCENKKTPEVSIKELQILFDIMYEYITIPYYKKD